jgi:hypothetical protein
MASAKASDKADVRIAKHMSFRSPCCTKVSHDVAFENPPFPPVHCLTPQSGSTVAPCEDVRRRGCLLLFLLRGQGLELPVLVHGFDGPVELLAECLGEEFLNGDVKFLGEDDGETGIDVVLDQVSMS